MSQYHILNIQQGDKTVSKYIEAIKPLEWQTSPNSVIGSQPLSVNAHEYIKPTLFKTYVDKLGPDGLPHLSIFNTDDNTKQYSYDIKKCDTCLLFNYIDQSKKDPNVDCSFTYPGREFDIKASTSDKYEPDKNLVFDDFNIILRNGELHFAQTDKEKFTNYINISNTLFDLKDKKLLDAIPYQRITESGLYVLCHTEEDIIVLYFKKAEKGYDFGILHKVDKAKKKLKYNSITAFAATENAIAIVYTGLDFGVAVLKDGDVVKKQIMDVDKKPLIISDAKFSTGTAHVFFISKNKGLFAYNVNSGKLTGVEHPYLTQIDKVSSPQEGQHEFIGVLVDQGQEDFKEVLIEFVFTLDTKELNLNKVFTTDNLKFPSNLVATKDFYFLFNFDTVYLLPARQPSKIFTLGTKVQFAGEEIKNFTVFITIGNEFLYVKNGKLVSEKKTGQREFTCKFGLFEKYTVDFKNFKVGFLDWLDTNFKTFNFTVEGGGFPLWIILLICGIVAVAIIGVVIGCYIRKRNINHASNAQLL
jgi:hypothetical protein